MERERHIEDLKKIASLSKNKKNVKTQKQRNLLGKNVITAIKGIGCRPDKVFYKPSTNFSVNGSLSNKKGLRKIGKGEMGEVFLGCVDKECKKPVAIKISNGSNRYEYKIGKRIEKLSGMRMYAYQECVNEKNKKYSEPGQYSKDFKARKNDKTWASEISID